MTEDEIIKALECCLAKENCEVISCEKCPLEKQYECTDIMFHQTIDLINRQKAEIKGWKEQNIRLNKECDHYFRFASTAKSEAIKEFAERLKEKATGTFFEECKYVNTEDIDNLVEEMVGDKE